ncbi:hypothetical protein [Spongiimicrobium sp. 3-5]|uniref:hypothetical protein n=1 Tax=Spongiimicrobium sp. 3-5 TaxID=3332596 RepID=UPI003981684A
MEERLRAEIKDTFLGYGLDRMEFFGPKEFMKRYPTLVTNEQELLELIYEIMDFDAELLDSLNGNGKRIFLLIATPKAKTFLNYGGFTKIHQKETEEWERLFHRLRELRFTRKHKMTISKNGPPGYVLKNWRYYVFVAMAIFSFCYCILDAFLDYWP